MKILVSHSKYQIQGGEDCVFLQESELLNTTHKVETLTFQNQYGWRGALQFLGSIWNVFAAYKLKSKIHHISPDLIHIHNWHFASGPTIIRTAYKAGIPVVVTLHNYRLICPSATMLYDGAQFTSSLRVSFPWVAVWKGVYKNNFFLTFWLAFVVWFHKKIGTWDLVDRYLILTEFGRNLFINSTLGLPSEKFTVKPNFVYSPVISQSKRDNSFLFIGRLSEEKGINILIDAFRYTGFPLRIAGDGPMQKFILETSGMISSIQYLGKLDKSAIQRELSNCTALVFPSVWYEGMPMTLLEAFAAGTPVIASDLGAMATMIQPGRNGLHFKAGNAIALASELQRWQSFSEREKDVFRQNARIIYESEYTPQKNLEQLLSIYQQIIHEKKSS